MEKITFYLNGDTQGLPFIPKDDAVKMQKSTPFLTTISTVAPNGQYWYEALVMKKGGKEQQLPETLSYQTIVYTLVNGHEDWYELAKQNGITLAQKQDFLLLFEKLNPAAFFPLAELAAFNLPENKIKGRPVVVFNLIKGKLALKGRDELAQNYTKLLSDENAAFLCQKDQSVLFWVDCGNTPILSFDNTLILSPSGAFIDITLLDEPQLIKKEVLQNRWNKVDMKHLSDKAPLPDVARLLKKAAMITTLAPYKLKKKEDRQNWPLYIKKALFNRYNLPKFFP